MISSGSHPRFNLIRLDKDGRLAAFTRDVAAGLSASPKRLSCCYFYDALGSALFEAICRLPEYYLTRAEEEILRDHSEEIAALFPAPTDLIELGSGSAVKTRLLIEAFLRRHPVQRYVPLDICRTVLEESSLELVRAYPNLTVLAIAAEYHEGLDYLRTKEAQGKLILWLGSNIGNFERKEAARFLRQLRQTLAPGDRLLIGIDLRKDRATLEAAYDDPCGVTAAFNRNILARINRELGGSFDLRTFAHRAVYDEEQGRVEMYLVSDRAQRVMIEKAELEISFSAGEAIHTENSVKYSLAEIDMLARTVGVRRERSWFDGQKRFGLHLFGLP
jgi:L-histidine N-alpha-methyltransferase